MKKILTILMLLFSLTLMAQTIHMDGRELVTNGGFDTVTTGWTTFACTFISTSGNGVITNTGTNGKIYQALSLIEGNLYKFSAENIQGSLNMYLSTGIDTGGAIESINTSSAGMYGFEFIAGSTNYVLVYNIGAPTTVGSIDNVSVIDITATVEMDGRDLLSGWDFTSGWTLIGSGIVDDNNSFSTGVGSAGGIIKSYLEDGKTYRLIIEGNTTDANPIIYTSVSVGFPNTALGDINGIYNFECVDNQTYIYIRNSEASKTTNITRLEITDITNSITYPTTSGNLVLDMPLCEPWTEGGVELVTSVDYDTTFESKRHATADATSMTLTGDAAETAYVWDQTFWDATCNNKKYSITFTTSGSTYTGDSKVFLSYVTTENIYIDGNGNQLSSDGVHTISITKSSAVTNYTRLAFFSAISATGEEVTISNISIVELNATTKDLSYSQADGTVSGATIQYDGLANVSAGIAYVPSDVAYGEWVFDFNKGADANQVKVQIIGSATSNYETNQGYFMSNDQNERISLYRSNGVGGTGTLFYTDTSYFTINTDYRIRITRTEAGVFTVYIKGGVFGWDSWTLVNVSGGDGTNPVTDNTYTSSSYLVADLDASDTISDLHINGNPISLQSATQSTGTWTTTAPSYDFNGTTDYISIDDTDALSFGNGTTDSPFSISAWVNMDDATSFIIVSKGIYNTDGEWLFWTTGDKLYFQLFDESVAGCYVSRKYNTVITSYEGQWIYIVGTYDGRGGTNAEDGIKIYLNGNRVDDTDSKGGTYVAMENLNHDVLIGRYSANYSNGQIKGVKIWNKELTQTEITYEYNTSWRR